jgi:hypothetical protein
MKSSARSSTSSLKARSTKGGSAVLIDSVALLSASFHRPYF